nr:hypothetical protein NZ312_05370 [Clostridioides difficile]
MKYVGLLLASVGIFLLIAVNFYYNSITLDMQQIEDYVMETNLILEDVAEKENYVSNEKEDYISRLMHVKKGIESSKTSFLIERYKEYKVKSIESLIYTISEEKKDYLDEVDRYNKLGEKEINKLINKNFLEVTYLSITTYI